MTVSRYAALTVAAAAFAVAGTGCHRDRFTTAGGDAGNSGKQFLHVEGVSTDQVEVLPPTVSVTENVMTVTGTVRRKDNAPDGLAGRVDIDVLGPDGVRIGFPWIAGLAPPVVSADAAGSTYAPNIGYLPVKGSTIRVRFLTRQEAQAEDNVNRDPNNTGNGGHTGEDQPHQKPSVGSGTSGGQTY